MSNTYEGVDKIDYDNLSKTQEEVKHEKKRKQVDENIKEIQDKLDNNKKEIFEAIPYLKNKTKDDLLIIKDREDIREIEDMINKLPTAAFILGKDIDDLDYDINSYEREIQKIKDELYLNNEEILAEKTIPQKEARTRLILYNDKVYNTIENKKLALEQEKKRRLRNLNYALTTLDAVKKFHNRHIQKMAIDKRIREEEERGGI